MANIVVVGQKAANQAFNPAIQQAQAQVPAINNLYSTLLQGLQNQGQSQLQNVLTSADQRGVMRASQPASTQQALDSSLMQAGAQLGAQQAQNVAGVRGIAGQGQAQRALAAQQMVEGLTAADLAKRENQLKLTEINRADEINTIRSQVAEAKAAARASARADEKGIADLSESDIKRALRLQLNERAMVNGKVGPKELAGALKIYRQAGLSDEKFWKEFQGYWDDKNPSYNLGMEYWLGKK